ncbi:MAG: Integrase catalytic subunit [Parcubacteria group bacterium GW2011_GWA1_42_7]|uniref:Integrase catalytic subunit n=1 Tax=Candidatus Woesebacteria bacterium GW2011_GWD1_38_10 TaxID=1618592 RepID=A0A0G0KCQ8_9BACT|nr:MAG: Integrase catalytic subunit [Candidatus Woesebacteria bacterium GW2011_GWD1_38_10]KKS64164.1 MAG: Integrase catalytic subunit [Parcubacteria group bacterium GW2011_GWB1_42_6]KKS68836.1 MAG: Integrase catalytic subunit [Parcubacteria group bacterium GW2011_GWA1_42_7]KKU09456.1 MAG: Integrase catalytic subunit [Parcubacteria group bacterium GW2011_GWF1_45_5]
MNAIDKIYTDLPFYGSRRIQWELGQNHKIQVCRQHVQRLMRMMGIEAVYPKKNTSRENILHAKYPYLLKNITASVINQIWGTDITYIKLECGFAFLAAIIDWYSRYVVAWKLSPTLEMDFCVENLKTALKFATPQIHNSDQGSHFTSPRYTGILSEKEIQISMDGRGRCMDNIFTERLWRTVKYENVYMASYANFAQANAGLKTYFNFYNNQRPHSSLRNQTPSQIYFKDRTILQKN